MKTQLLPAIILTLAFNFSHAHAAEKLPIETNADLIILPKLEFQSVPLATAVTKLEELSKKADPKSKGIPFVLDPAVDQSGLSPMTISLVGVSVLKAADFIASANGLKLRPEADSIVFVKK